jgi:hypothetical protein
MERNILRMLFLCDDVIGAHTGASAWRTAKENPMKARSQRSFALWLAFGMAIVHWQLTAGIKMLHVPYKGSNPAIQP